MKNKPIIEDVDSHEMSSSDIEHYIPSNNDTKLEFDESVYSNLEYISLDWPSQTIIYQNEQIYVATNPVTDNASTIIKFDFSNIDIFTNFEKFTSNTYETTQNYNRLRIKDFHLVCLADESLDLYKYENMSKLTSIEGYYGYGLSLRENIFVGNKDGSINVYNYDGIIIDNYKYHKKTVETIVVDNSILFSGSCDNTIIGCDMRSKQVAYKYEYNCDINAIDYCDKRLIAGCDNGMILLTDLRNNMTEKIKWHVTPVSYVKWKNESEFVTCSDEQVTIWDTTFVEEWEYHKYLRFVHQGQKLYKEVCFMDDLYVVTSIDGLCFFKLAI